MTTLADKLREIGTHRPEITRGLDFAAAIIDREYSRFTANEIDGREYRVAWAEGCRLLQETANG